MRSAASVYLFDSDDSKQLTSQGKIPHDVELEKHPEKSLQGRSWLMGDVSAMIHVSDGSLEWDIAED